MSFFRLALFLLIPAVTFAQQAKSRTCRIVFLQAPANAPEKLLLYDGADCREVELPRMNLSRIYELPGGARKLRLLKTAPVDPTQIPEGAPTVTVGEALTDLYLLVTSDPTNTIAPVRMQAIDAGSDKLKRGQSLWFNLSPNAVSGKLGKVTLAIAAGAREVVDAPANGSEDFPVSLSFRIPGDKRTFSLCESKWHHDPLSRNLVFIIPQPGLRSPRIIGFTDFRSPKRKDKES